MITSSSKLDFYASLKVSFGFSPYLSECTDPKLRRAITKLRISAHKLPIETERYMKTKAPREERICPFCCKSTGDEKHYLVDCRNKIFEDARAPLIKHFESKYPNFKEFDSEQKAVFLLGCKDPLSLKKVGKFCLLIHDLFQECFSVTK